MKNRNNLLSFWNGRMIETGKRVKKKKEIKIENIFSILKLVVLDLGCFEKCHKLLRFCVTNCYGFESSHSDFVQRSYFISRDCPF